MFTHVKTPDHHIETHTHLSHYLDMVSAYERSDEMFKSLVANIEEAWEKAKASESPQATDLDGPMFFLVYPRKDTLSFSLCTPIKHFEVFKD